MSNKSGQPAPSTARAPSATGEQQPTKARARRPQASLEQDLYATCGALLGAIEALAYELPEPPPTRVERALRDARSYGQRVREQIEALTILGLEEVASNMERVPFGITRWLDHASRGAASNVAAHGATLVLPELAHLDHVRVPLAVSRMDRALSVMLEHLAKSAGPGATLALQVTHDAHAVTLELAATGVSGEGVTPISPVFIRAWTRLLDFHHGSFQYDAEALRITCVLPAEGNAP